jgi:hypothetical protein
MALSSGSTQRERQQLAAAKHGSARVIRMIVNCCLTDAARSNERQLAPVIKQFRRSRLISRSRQQRNGVPLAV